MRIILIALFATLAVLAATIAQAQTTTRCIKNWDGSVTCTTTKTSPFGY
jgi:hypothetical protein